MSSISIYTTRGTVFYPPDETPEPALQDRIERFIAGGRLDVLVEEGTRIYHRVKLDGERDEDHFIRFEASFDDQDDPYTALVEHLQAIQGITLQSTTPPTERNWPGWIATLASVSPTIPGDIDAAALRQNLRDSRSSATFGTDSHTNALRVCKALACDELDVAVAPSLSTMDIEPDVHIQYGDEYNQFEALDSGAAAALSKVTAGTFETLQTSFATAYQVASRFVTTTAHSSISVLRALPLPSDIVVRCRRVIERPQQSEYYRSLATTVEMVATADNFSREQRIIALREMRRILLAASIRPNLPDVILPGSMLVSDSDSIPTKSPRTDTTDDDGTWIQFEPVTFDSASSSSSDSSEIRHRKPDGGHAPVGSDLHPDLQTTVDKFSAIIDSLEESELHWYDRWRILESSRKELSNRLSNLEHTYLSEGVLAAVSDFESELSAMAAITDSSLGELSAKAAKANSIFQPSQRRWKRWLLLVFGVVLGVVVGHYWPVVFRFVPLPF